MYLEHAYRDPFSDRLDGFLAEQEVLEFSQRSVGVDTATLVEDVTIALEVVTRRTCQVKPSTTVSHYSSEHKSMCNVSLKHILSNEL